MLIATDYPENLSTFFKQPFPFAMDLLLLTALYRRLGSLPPIPRAIPHFEDIRYENRNGESKHSRKALEAR